MSKLVRKLVETTFLVFSLLFCGLAVSVLLAQTPPTGPPPSDQGCITDSTSCSETLPDAELTPIPWCKEPYTKCVDREDCANWEFAFCDSTVGDEPKKVAKSCLPCGGGTKKGSPCNCYHCRTNNPMAAPAEPDAVCNEVFVCGWVAMVHDCINQGKCSESKTSHKVKVLCEGSGGKM